MTERHEKGQGISRGYSRYQKVGMQIYYKQYPLLHKRFSAGLIPPRKFSPQLEIAVVGRTIKSESERERERERGTLQCQCYEEVHYDMLQSC